MRRFVVAPLLAVALVVSVQSAVPASGSTRVFVIDGRGWGHGHGMGQYGARAMAEAGLRWYRILPRYYSGIRLQHVSSSMRVRVFLRHASAIIVKPETKLTITNAAGKKIASAWRARTFFRIGRAGASYAIDVAPSADGPWKRIATGRSRLIRITAVRQVLDLTDNRWYRGLLDLMPSGRGLDVIANVPLETYVAEVVPREMPAWWPANALEAQAVAARTYVVRAMQEARAHQETFDICASARCQVFGGYARMHHGAFQVLESNETSKAVRATAGWIMTYRGRPIFAQYSSSTGGYTASGGEPYLKAVPDPWDARAPMHSWSEIVTPQQIHALWPAIGSVRSIRAGRRDGHGDLGGRAQSVVLQGSRGAILVSTSAFAADLGLPSSWFAVHARTAGYIFRFDMGYGTSNAAVSHLQRRLRAEGVYPRNAPITDYFGPITRASLERYQRAHGIRPTGFLGPITRGSLNASA